MEKHLLPGAIIIGVSLVLDVSFPGQEGPGIGADGTKKIPPGLAG